MGEADRLVTQTALAIRDADELEVAESVLDAALRRAKADGVREIRQLRRHLRVALDHAEQHNEGCLYCGEGEIVDGDTTPTHRAKCWYYKAARAARIEEGV